MSNCKDCGREEWGFLSALDDEGRCYSCAAKHNKEKIKRLQEQLNEANKVIKKYMAVAFEIRSEEEKPTVLQLAFNYLKKWGVK